MPTRPGATSKIPHKDYTIAHRRVLGPDILNPGHTRTQRLFNPIRERVIQAGVYRPPNRWRKQAVHADKVHYTPPNNPSQNILQRPLLLADRVPWNWKCYAPRG
jgi:hypothetical protein